MTKDDIIVKKEKKKSIAIAMMQLGIGANIFWIASRKVYSDGEKCARKDVTLSRGANKLQKEQRLLKATRTLYNERCSTYSAR